MTITDQEAVKMTNEEAIKRLRRLAEADIMPCANAWDRMALSRAIKALEGEVYANVDKVPIAWRHHCGEQQGDPGYWEPLYSRTEHTPRSPMGSGGQFSTGGMG